MSSEIPSVVARAVECICGWKGRRKPKVCDYDHGDYDHCYCVFGFCPKCSHHLRTSLDVRQSAIDQAKVDKWWVEHREEEMRRINECYANTGSGCQGGQGEVET